MFSPPPAEPVALKVFGIPELAHLICTIIRKHNNVNLMQACRKLFCSILPFVWEQVDGPDPLISMIPGGGIVYHESESELSPYAIMQLPGSLELSRFNIYAPHVKRLMLSSIHVDVYEEWERFHSCTRSVDLLPNLETIHFPAPHLSKSVSNNNQVEIDAVNWVIAFLSTSLQALVQAPPKVTHSIQATSPLWLDFDSFHNILTSVAQKCPRLHSLNILPAQTTPTESINRQDLGPLFRISFSYNSPKTYSNFFQLSNLTSLLISVVILCPKGLAALSSLPKLEWLCVVDSVLNGEVYYDKVQLATGALPALKHLELIHLNWITIATLCNVKCLISGLQSLRITHPHFYMFSYLVELKNLSDVVLLLATHNSRIIRLSVYGLGDYQVSPKGLQSWSRLPLVSLDLGWVIGRTCKFDGLSSILSCLPLLEDLELRMAQIFFDLGQLRTIIQLLPRLRRLRIPDSWQYATELTDADFTPSQSLSNDTLYLESGFYLSNPREENAKMVARYLSILRPLAPVICEAYRADPYFYDVTEHTSEGSKDMINVELFRLRVR